MQGGRHKTSTLILFPVSVFSFQSADDPRWWIQLQVLLKGHTGVQGVENVWITILSQAPKDR